MWKLTRLWATLSGLAAALALASPALAKPPVWIVRDADSEIVLFGSIHVLPPGLDWRPAALDQAMAAADDIWFELPIDPASEAETGRLAAAKGYLPADQSLNALLSPKARTRLAAACVKYGLSPDQIDRLEPWYAEVALAVAQFRGEGANTDVGVEKTLSAAAPATAARRAFETPAQQIDMFDAAPRAAQVASLEESLAELETDPKAYGKLLSAWMKGDVRRLDKEALAPLRRASPAIFERLVTARNKAWTQTLDARLKGKGRTVVVVGVGHLIGPGGVPARLRALGYSVEGP
ncbi:TraB/GumN family protein [Phenylobacterium aquaticum]|uniref:TraB/GumN family protein n=1 Tax=Phenylobacterium aquaticum TaxID=1763816 RepID=UPI001F5C0B7D|nr:TraB/GumN family protein [Phenylobacterium aquaticum]MCI3133198.1 TraB/GumN family protein [Phenylobacterium aquaticum]